jgi:16S rRNA (adenine1518-N6/adenine1519-N6)-dimethyltransferase
MPMADDTSSPFASPKRTLVARGLRPRKRFGQNFLVDPRFAAKIVAAIPPDAFTIEIGGGTGALTQALAHVSRHTIVLEIDRGLVGVLNERFAEMRDVRVIEGDALEFDFAAALRPQARPRAICGNLPYQITTPLIERIVEASRDWESAVLMVQREYARRLAASPGTPDYGSLTVFVGFFCTVERIFDVGSAGFYPPPAVASSVVRLTPRAALPAARDRALLMRTIRAAFAQRRKTLANCLAARAADGAARGPIEAAVARAGLDPRIRGERLALDDFVRVADALAEAGVAIAAAD